MHFAGGGHNDALMMALVAAALALGERKRVQAAGVAWALAILDQVGAAAPPAAPRARGAGDRPPRRPSRLRGHRRRDARSRNVALAAPLAARRDAVDARRAPPDALRAAAPPRRSCVDVPRRRTASPTSGCCGRRREGARGSGSRSACCCSRCPYLIGWYVIWPLALAAWDDDDAATLLVARPVRVPTAPAPDVTARASARRARGGSPARGTPRGRAPRCGAASGSSVGERSIACRQRRAGSRAGPAPPTLRRSRSSRTASVSAVITGAPVASASKTTAGIARDS